jgi:RNA polymerase sigma factor (TIGR02999 family)
MTDTDQLFTALYLELHRLAEHNLHRAGASPTLSATTLLHEAYLNIAQRDSVAFPDQARFLAYASRAMRGLVIDYARQRRALKRGQQFEVTLSEELVPAAGMQNADELEQLADAIDELAQLEPAMAELVNLHFFCGYSFIDIAGLRGVSERTVQRDWRKARLLLHHTLRPESNGPESREG